MTYLFNSRQVVSRRLVNNIGVKEDLKDFGFFLSYSFNIAFFASYAAAQILFMSEDAGIEPKTIETMALAIELTTRLDYVFPSTRRIRKQPLLNLKIKTSSVGLFRWLLL